jgi:hypothetical protein
VSPPPCLVCCAMMHVFECWCSGKASVTDAPLLACCVSDPLCVFRRPASMPERASACTSDAAARISRPIGAEMAENEAI